MIPEPEVVIPSRLSEILAAHPNMHLAEALLRMTEDYDCEAAIKSAFQAASQPERGERAVSLDFPAILVAHTLVNTGWKPRKLLERWPFLAPVFEERPELKEQLDAGIIDYNVKNPPRWYPKLALNRRKMVHEYDTRITLIENARRIGCNKSVLRRAIPLEDRVCA